MDKKKPFYKRKWFLYFCGFYFLLAVIAGLTSESDPAEEQTAQSKTEVEKPKLDVAEDKPEKQAEPAVKEEVEKAPETIQMTKDDVLSMVEIDYETGYWENGMFQLKDSGELINADWYWFNEANGIKEGNAIFMDGKLDRVKLWFDDDSGIEEAFAKFGIYDTENIKRLRGVGFVYEYNFSGKFAEGNIARLPNEWD